MGIQGLLPFVKKASKHTHIKHFRNYTVGVDGFCWLHKGAFGCATKLAIGVDTDAYVLYFMKYINVLLDNGIKPVVVFDGRSLPAKEVTNQKRRESRAANKKKGKELLAQKNDKKAWECFTKCVEVTHAMVRNVIRVLQQRSIDYIVAPYEADAQLTYLANKGMVDMVITEDSDLIPFGCPKILFKLKLTGECVLYDRRKVHACMDVPLAKFQFDNFRQMCILSGCDYLPSINGVGLVRAKKFIRSSNSPPEINKVLKQLPSLLNMDVEVSDEYIEKFVEAENTFLYQLVFDPRSKTIVPLTAYPWNVDQKDMPYAGSPLKNDIAFQLAIGNINTKDLEVVGNFKFSDQRGYRSTTSIWSDDYEIPEKKDDVAEFKKSTKHSSTTGLKTSISLKTTPAKRRLRVEEEKKTTEDDEINMYTTCSYFENSSSGESPISKRAKTWSSSQTDSYNGSYNLSRESSTAHSSADELEFNDDKEISTTSRKLRSRNTLPFMKSPDIGLMAARKRPLHTLNRDEGEELVNHSVDKLISCEKKLIPVVEKNHIYADDKNLIVLSKYFKTEELSDDSESLESQGTSSVNAILNLYSIEPPSQYSVDSGYSSVQSSAATECESDSE